MHLKKLKLTLLILNSIIVESENKEKKVTINFFETLKKIKNSKLLSEYNINKIINYLLGSQDHTSAIKVKYYSTKKEMLDDVLNKLQIDISEFTEPILKISENNDKSILNNLLTDLGLQDDKLRNEIFTLLDTGEMISKANNIAIEIGNFSDKPTELYNKF